MNKLLGQRKKFNLVDLDSSLSFSSSGEEEYSPVVFSKFNISVSIDLDGSLVINSTATAEDLDSDYHSAEVPRIRKQRTQSQRSTHSARIQTRTTTADYVDDTSDDEAFMNNSANFINHSPSTRVRRSSLRKRKTSSLKRRPGVQTVPEQEATVPEEPEALNVFPTVSPLDTTMDGELSTTLEWIIDEDNYYTSTDSATSGCQVISEKSLIIANAETEDALTDSDWNPATEETGVFKIPYPVSYRPNLAKRKLALESDDEFISSTCQRPAKRNCIRY